MRAQEALDFEAPYLSSTEKRPEVSSGMSSANTFLSNLFYRVQKKQLFLRYDQKRVCDPRAARFASALVSQMRAIE